MHPILFEIGPVTIYTYGFCIAVGAILGFTYMAWQGRKQFNMSFDKANTLFIVLVLSSVVGGKVFFFFEKPAYYFKHFSELFSGSGFVFYGSLLFCIPAMLYFFQKNKLPVWGMLDIMGMVTCIVHATGRIGCFNAGCCYGTHTDFFLGVIYTNEKCQAPLGQSLHPVQLYESGFIFLLLGALWLFRERKQFDGQLFLLYLMSYAAGRSVLELFRGDEARGYIVPGWISHSQFISLIIIIISGVVYYQLKGKAKLATRSNIKQK
jgi:phosphatidylglycerol---prolipoprotein diacylglyceryl transferase